MIEPAKALRVAQLHGRVHEAALFLPHTDLNAFATVKREPRKRKK